MGFRIRWLSVALAAVLILYVGCTSSPTDPIPTTTTIVSSTGPISSPTPPETKVPNVRGETANDARATMVAASLLVDTKTKYTAQVTEGTVLSQTPGAKTVVESGATITLTIAKAFPVVPNVVGDKLTKARRTLKNGEFDVRVKKQVSTQPKDTVISQNPVGGTSARPGRQVTLIVAKPAPPTCDPNYTGACLQPNAIDYDCAGGGGDGPLFTGPVRVVGYDHYGLDGDGDGYGCE
jgi:hypothetical protein